MHIAESLTTYALNLPNFAASGSIGTATDTVDRVSFITVSQDDPGVSLTIPDPSFGVNGQKLVVGNVGTVDVTISGETIAVGFAAHFIWHDFGWLATRGPAGPIGSPGSPGADGADGAPGADGLNGDGTHSFSGTAVTNASGNAVFTFTPPFPATPVASLANGPGAPADATEARITAISPSGCTVNVRRSPAVTLLGISVLQAPQPAVGVTVQLTAKEPGRVVP